MPSFEALFAGLLLVLLAGGAVGFWAVLRRPSVSPASQALGEGRFADALAAVPSSARAGRDDLYAAAVAAKHLLRLDHARTLLDRILARDPRDGEAWLESGLVSAYAGDFPAAAGAFARVEPLRSDLLEPLTLHRAWLALRQGDARSAHRLFAEVEAPLENKLRSDLGSGEPLFAEWFLQAAALWRAFGDRERAEWAWREGKRSAPASRLPQVVDSDAEGRPPLQ